MTKEDAEQHAMAWALAARTILDSMGSAKQKGVVNLVLALLVASDLANAVAKGYNNLAESLE